MADDNVYCEACEELRKNSPNFVINGISDKECAYLQNDQGLNGKSNDCTDLNNINDCMIGSMADEAAISDTCGWRDYMQCKLAPNLWMTFKAIICAICGIWSNVWDLWTHVEKLECVVGYMGDGASFEIGEEETSGSYIVAGKGISFMTSGTGDRETDVTATYIAGGLMIINGTLRFNGEDFEDSGECWNFDNGSEIRQSKDRKGNSLWNNTSGTMAHMVTYGELLYEIRINLEEHPEIDEVFPGIGAPTGYGGYQVNYTRFTEGQYAAGQHGRCDTSTGEPTQDGFSRGHLVPEGWLYIQARMINISYLHANNGRYSPRGLMGIRLNEENIPCG